MSRQSREAGGGVKEDLGTGLEEGCRGGAAGRWGLSGGGERSRWRRGGGRPRGEAEVWGGEGRTRKRLLPSETVAEENPTLRRAVLGSPAHLRVTRTRAPDSLSSNPRRA